MVAASGLGKTNAKGLIVPRFGNEPENHVAISMSFETFSELMLMTKAHFGAWLAAQYMNRSSAPRLKGVSYPGTLQWIVNLFRI